MAIFYLKYRDTRPTLEVELRNPDGTVHNLTDATVNLLIKLNNGTKLSREMAVYGDPTDGIVRYTWSVEDWEEDNEGGFLIKGPTFPLKPKDVEHLMEYEVVNGDARMTFPNDGWDVLRIYEDLSDIEEVAP